MAAFGEQNLTRKSLLEFAQSQHRFWPNGAVNKIYPTGLGALDINEFTEIYPEWVWQYWLHTGDRTLLAALYPVLTKLSGYVYESIASSTGLVNNLPATNIYYSFPVVTRLNVLGANVFGRTADVAAALNRPKSEVSQARQRQASLAAAINRRLTRLDGTYVDGLDAGGHHVPQASQEANACALAYGVVPPRLRATVGAYVASLGMSAPPRTATEVLEALALAGRDDDVLRRLTDPTTDGWAKILAQGGTFTWEVWEPSDVNGDSMSHGWGSNVLVVIQQRLLGVRPTGPGYSSFDVSPPRSGLQWASGTVPTPRGTVEVAWHRPAGTDRAFTVDLAVPPNVTARVRLPAARESDVTESGHPVSRVAGVRLLDVRRGDVTLRVGGGHYQLRSVSPGT
jgi:alpha-L-rhamnosidase